MAPLPDDRFRIVATPEQPSLEFVQGLLDERVPAAEPGHVVDMFWSSRFRIHHRVARSFRCGRTLFCGDAAHVHSPADGRGMNTGIQDAVALAEPLVGILAGGGDAALESWAERRREIAKGVVSLTDRLTRAATIRSSLVRGLRNMAIIFTGHLPPVRTTLARRLAELDSR